MRREAHVHYWPRSGPEGWHEVLWFLKIIFRMWVVNMTVKTLLTKKTSQICFRTFQRHKMWLLKQRESFHLGWLCTVHLCMSKHEGGTLLSSITVLSDSIHIGSMSPSNTIHLGPGWEMFACSRISDESKPYMGLKSRNERMRLFALQKNILDITIPLHC